MPIDLYRLVYYSRNEIGGSADHVGVQIRDILGASRRNNGAAGVTGVLMFNAGCFAQVLEGGRDIVEATFERIQRDERHGEVSLLHFEAAADRIFGHWSMGFIGARPEAAGAYGDVASVSGFDPSRASGDAVVEVLRRLALEQEAA